jgi:TIR domain-containing protein
MPAQNPTRLFVSHISEEAEIAALLKQTIEEDFLDLVKLFQSSDIGSIVAGDDWLAAVQQALQDSAAVIVLCSHASIQRPWVQFELGAAWSRQVPIIPICHSGLRAADLPMPLSRKEAVELAAPDGFARLYQAIAQLIDLKRIPELGNLPELQQRFCELAQRFQQAGVQQFERYIDIVIPPPGRLDGPAIPMTTKVESNDASLELFGLIGSSGRIWADIVKAASRARDKRWLAELQHCVHKASQNEMFRPVQAVYHADEASYQPQLAKKECLADGTARFHVHFVETVVAPLMEIQNDFGLLATLGRLGLRFRYEVIERYPKLVRAAAIECPEPQAAAKYVLQKVRGAVEVIENDAMSRGAENIDPEAVAALFEQHEDQEEMTVIQKIWGTSRAALFKDDPPPTAAELDTIIGPMREMNFRFMRLATRRYHEMICSRWAPKPIRTSRAAQPPATAAPAAAASP